MIQTDWTTNEIKLVLKYFLVSYDPKERKTRLARGWIRVKEWITTGHWYNYSYHDCGVTAFARAIAREANEFNVPWPKDKSLSHALHKHGITYSRRWIFDKEEPITYTPLGIPHKPKRVSKQREASNIHNLFKDLGI